jgi:hypothetical protein
MSGKAHSNWLVAIPRLEGTPAEAAGNASGFLRVYLSWFRTACALDHFQHGRKIHLDIAAAYQRNEVLREQRFRYQPSIMICIGSAVLSKRSPFPPDA